jgi:hypothetical protein
MGHLQLAGHFPLRQAAVKTCLRANGKQIRAALSEERQNICNGIAGPVFIRRYGAKPMRSQAAEKWQNQGRFREQFVIAFQWLKSLKDQCCNAKS